MNVLVLVYSLGLSAPASRLDIDDLEGMVASLQRAAGEMSPHVELVRDS